MAADLLPAGDVPPADAAEAPPWAEVPVRLEPLPDGREAVVTGDVGGLAALVHRQGDNPFGFQGTCGLASVESVLRQFGRDVTEGEVTAYAVGRGRCCADGPPDTAGGTTVADQALLLRDFGMTAFIDVGDSVARLAARVEEGRGVIAEVNAGVFWGAAEYYGDGGANHAVVVTGTARDAATGELLGVFVNDSGEPAAGRFVDAARMRAAFADAGGWCVCTDRVRAPGPALDAPAPDPFPPRTHP